MDDQRKFTEQETQEWLDALERALSRGSIKDYRKLLNS